MILKTDLKFCVSLEHGLNFWSQGERGHLRIKECHIFSIRSYKVLTEVPGRLLICGLGEEFKHRMSLASSHHTFLKHIKLNLVACCKRGDVSCIAGLLATKAVTREGEDRELGRAEPFVQLVQFFVVPIGVTSLRRYVHNKRYLSSILVKADWCTIQFISR